MTALADHLQAFLEHRRCLRFSPHTLEGNRLNIKAFLFWLQLTYQVLTADGLRADHLRAYQAHLTSETTADGLPRKPGSINCRIKAVRGYLFYLHENGHIVTNLANVLRYVKEPKTLPTSVLTHEQVRAFIASIDTSTATGYRNRTIIEILYSCGIRNMELRGLDLDHIDLSNAALLVTGKGDKQRVVPIGTTALTCLRTYLNAIRPFWTNPDRCPAVFLNRHGGRFSRRGIADILRTLRENQGLAIPVTPHTLRRSCTTELVRADANLYHIKQLLGHESLDTLEPYTKLTIGDLRRTHAACHPRERDPS